MQCRYNWVGQSKSSVLILIFVTLIIALSGCTKSVRKVSYVTDDSTALQSLSSRDETTSIQDKSAQYLVNAGAIYLANQNLKIAELHFVAAINKDPKMTDAYIGLGRVEILKGNYSNAMVSFAKARELSPDSAQALIGEAHALRSEGKLNNAIKKINAAMAIEPGDINVLKELAIIYDLMGKENLSEPLYREIIAIAPDQAEGHNNMGLNDMVRGRYQEASLSFLQALALDGDNPRIKNNLASAYLLNGDKENALKIFKGTVGDAEAYNNVGYLLMTQRNFDEAERALNKAIQLNPRHYVRAQENLDKLQQMRHAAYASRP